MAMASYLSLLPLLLLLVSIGATRPWEPEIRLPNEQQQEEEEEEEAKVGTRWAVLVAGSKSWDNYRHQADVCHAYQVLKKGGLKEENIVVFMYNDIASNPANPNPGTIINHPNGTDVYAGVPKDYTGEHATAANLYAVLLGDKSALKGGSGKVVDSKPHDSIFFFFSDHGGPGVLGMPSGPSIYATDFIDTLKKKHAAKGFREMVMYIEACESGSVFEGIMPNDINVYVTTASNAQESSYGTYCPGMEPSPPPQYHTCLGDLYSVAWIEDSETHNLKRETIKQQFNTVKDRTSKLNGVALGSHVMEYGDTSIKKEKLYLYLGFNPASVNYPPNKLDPAPTSAVNQRDADLVYLWHKYTKSEEGSEEKMEILKEIREKTRHRGHVDESVKLMGLILYGPQIGSSLLESVRPRGLTLVDDWECLKSTVRTFEKHCGLLTQYGMKHMRAFANICNSGVSRESVEEAAMAACATYHNSNYGNTNGVFTFTA